MDLHFMVLLDVLFVSVPLLCCVLASILNTGSDGSNITIRNYHVALGISFFNLRC